MLVVPFAHRRVLGVVVGMAERSEVPPEKLAAPLAALEADVPPELVNLGLWVAARVLLHPARGLALVLPPGTGTGAAGGCARAARWWPRSPRPGRDARRGDERLGARQRAALEALKAGPRRVGELAPPPAATTPRPPLEQRGLVELDWTPAAPPQRPRTALVGARPSGARAHRRPGARRSQEIAAAARTPPRRPAAAAARGDRQREDRGLPAGGGRGAGARPQRHRARARDRADPQTAGRFVERFGDHRGRAALPAHRARALRRVVAPALGRRRACAWARVRPCSPRSRTWA